MFVVFPHSPSQWQKSRECMANQELVKNRSDFFNGGNFFIFESIQLQLEEFCCRCVIVEAALWHCQTLLQKGIPLHPARLQTHNKDISFE